MDEQYKPLTQLTEEEKKELSEMDRDWETICC